MMTLGMGRDLVRLDHAITYAPTDPNGGDIPIGDFTGSPPVIVTEGGDPITPETGETIPVG